MKTRLSCLLFVFLFACADKKVDLSGDVPIKAADFLAVFPVIKSVFTVADTNLGKMADTIQIGYKALQQFMPDSALSSITKDKKVLIHPVGRIEKDKEIYLLVNFTRHDKTRLAVFVTDKKNRFLAVKELLSNGNEDGYHHSVSINREPTFIISKEKDGKNNTLQFSRAGWVYNDAGMFMVVINDSNEDPKKQTVINPLDTLPHRNKFSGDYVQDKKNFVSIRDGKNINTYQFFIHFEKNEGTCIGELKGECKIKGTGTAQFSENGDPCVIDFTFEDDELKVKEQGSCGNHRGIKCYFDDTYRKKKESRQVRKK